MFVDLRTLLRVLALLGCGFAILNAGYIFYSHFPGDHSLSEMLLNYQGGFIKRGLIGEVAFQIHEFIPAKWSITILITVLHLAVAASLILLATQTLNVASLFFLASPATIWFPIHAQEAFGRKDVIIIAAYLISIFFTKRYVSSPNRVLAAYAICITPLALAPFSHDSRPGIIYSWESLGADIHQNALCCITISFSHANTIATNTLGKVGTSYLSSLLLALIPFAILLFERHLPTISNFNRVCILGAVALMLGPFALATDWRRYIYLFTVHIFVFAYITTEFRGDVPRSIVIASLPFAVLYGLSWTMPHFAQGIRAGWLFSN